MSTKRKNEIRSEVAADPEGYAESYRRALEASGSPASAGASAASGLEKPAPGATNLSTWLPVIDAQLRVTLKKRVAKLARKRGVKPNDVVETLMELLSREFEDEVSAPSTSAAPLDPDDVPAMPCVHPTEGMHYGEMLGSFPHTPSPFPYSPGGAAFAGPGGGDVGSGGGPTSVPRSPSRGPSIRRKSRALPLRRPPSTKSGAGSGR